MALKKDEWEKYWPVYRNAASKSKRGKPVKGYPAGIEALVERVRAEESLKRDLAVYKAKMRVFSQLYSALEELKTLYLAKDAYELLRSRLWDLAARETEKKG